MDNETDSPFEETTRLRDAPQPPPALESRVVAALRAEGQIGGRRQSSSLVRIAASILIFASGVFLGRYVPTSEVIDHATPRYMLLLAGDVTPAADGSSRAAEYADWARSLAARGTAVMGDELSDHAEIVANNAATSFSDLTSIGGYFVISAGNDAEAAALARTCPHVKYGGSIVVRRIQ